MKKILLIGDSSINDSPYIKSYIEILESEGVKYDLVFWNKNLDEVSSLPQNYIPYNTYTNNNYPAWKKIYKFYFFSSFVKKIIRNNNYSSIIVFTIAHAIYFYDILSKSYKNKFIFDIRDSSPMCKIGFLKKIMKNLIYKSSFTVISSKGFLRWLPDLNKEYVIAHNVTIENLKKYLLNPNLPLRKLNLKILTIGAIRDYESNSFIINNLCNDNNFELQFSGVGICSDLLKKYVVDNKINNVSFTGRYLKSDEMKIAGECDMINIYYSRSEISDTAISNRFYLSAMLRKPMIVNEGSYQAELVRKYGIGVVIAPNDNVKRVILDYWNKIDVNMYNEGCIRFLNDTMSEVSDFRERILRFAD